MHLSSSFFLPVVLSHWSTRRGVSPAACGCRSWIDRYGCSVHMLPRKPNQKNEEEKRRRKREKKKPPVRRTKPLYYSASCQQRWKPTKETQKKSRSFDRPCQHSSAAARDDCSAPKPARRSRHPAAGLGSADTTHVATGHYHAFIQCACWSGPIYCLLALRDTTHSMCLTIPTYHCIHRSASANPARPVFFRCVFFNKIK
ncbi:hypothetical protein LY76DRAFT_282870 [Colletotrichum caudatum]|nr:hypothetical protein LY76DRAFT_282870 [Colletotrichum caudatum]